MKNKVELSPDWANATWEGHRKAQIRACLRLSYAERFKALEDFSETSHWLASAKSRTVSKQ